VTLSTDHAPRREGLRRRSTAVHPLILLLRQRRVALGWSQVILSRRLGYDKCTLVRWESGERSPNLRRLTDWCEALGVEMRWG
jgi:transcriptional regulator with XRE-family HTH domain